jgi:superfamily II DNA or RNA helicase
VTRIFDNVKTALGPHLQETLAESYRMDVAVGYFNLRGWEVFDSQVNSMSNQGDKPIARVLVGMLVSTAQVEALQELQRELDGSVDVADLADNQKAAARRNELLSDFRMQLSRGIPNEKSRKTLASLRDQVASGAVEVKVFTRKPLHGKTYIFHRDTNNAPIVGFVGSSNLTASGLQSNLELNVDVLDSAASQDLSDWFEDKWNDHFSISIGKELLDLISQSWVEPAKPFDVYMRLCFELARDIREGRDEYSISGPIDKKLLDYQKQAVRTLAKRIVTRGGTMLGDVVGLGKTLTAVAVAIVMRDEYAYSTLVVCPKNLVSMWEEHLHLYQVHGKVVSYSMAAKELPNMEKYRFVIIDESHTMRNDERKDYKALHNYVREYDSKLLLLTATPYNIGFSDVANQLKLWIDSDTDLGLQPIAAMAKDPTLADKVDGKVSTIGAFLRSDEPEDWQRLMSEHMVRRTRSFIKNVAIAAGDVDDEGPYLVFSDGSRFHFPKRKPMPITHSFGENDPATKMVSDETLKAISDLSLPRYDLSAYMDKGVTLTVEEEAIVTDWKRSRGQVKGFVRTNLYKRLSSCGHSFTVSLERHISRNNLFLYALEAGLDVPTGTILENMFAPLDSDGDYEDEVANEVNDSARYDALRESGGSGITWVRPSLFNAEFKLRLEQDTQALQSLLDSYGTWSVEVDSKVKALHSLLADTHKDEKVLIFTEYKDTAIYLGKALKSLGIKEIEVATGDSENPTILAHRFSPESNQILDESSPTPLGDPIRVLVATDVLSEGQNLQDSHVVINYDLPWAIIKLIQRAGRIDRVGQKAKTVFVYSMFHGDMDRVLDLRRRIKKRLADNAKVFGSDEQFFGSPEEVNAIKNAFQGEELLEEEDRIGVDAASLAFEAWTQAVMNDPTLETRIPSLPDLIHSTKAKPAPKGVQPGIATFVKTEVGHIAFGYASGDGNLRLITGQEALRFFSCTPETVPLPDRDDFHLLINSLVSGKSAPLSIASVTHSALKGVRKQVWNALTETLHATQEVNEALEFIHQHPLTEDAERTLRRVLRTKNIEELAATLVRLHTEQRLVVISAQDDVLRIVCTMGIAE